jgi:hypothetical protein
MVTTARIVNSLTSTKENKYTATLPLIITSKIKIDGMMETNRYMLVIITMAFT